MTLKIILGQGSRQKMYKQNYWEISNNYTPYPSKKQKFAISVIDMRKRFKC